MGWPIFWSAHFLLAYANYDERANYFRRIISYHKSKMPLNFDRRASTKQNIEYCTMRPPSLGGKNVTDYSI